MQNKSLKKYIRRFVLALIFIFLVLSFFIHPVKIDEKSTGYNGVDFKDNKYGLYLSSFRAEVMGDYFNLNKFYNEAVSQNGNDFLGKSYIINAKDNEEIAVKNAQKELEKNPSNVIATIYLSYVDFKNGNYNDAYNKLNNIKNKSDTFMIKLLKSWVLIAQNKNDKAMDLLETEINNPAFDNVILMNLAIQAELSNDNDYAEELYEEAQTTSLNLLDIETIVNFYLKNNRKQKAIDVVMQYLKKAPNSISATSLLKAIENDTYTPYYIDTPQKGMAKSIFDISNIIVTLFPSATDLYLMYIDMVLNLDSNFYMAQIMKAEIFRKYNKFNEYKSISESVPTENYLSLINKINYAAFLLKQPEHQFEAVALYKDLIKQNPAILQLYQNLGDYYEDKNDCDKAIEYYTAGIDQANDNKILKSELYFARGVCYDTLKKTNEAKKDLEQAVVLSPKNPVILNYYSYFLLLNNEDVENAFKLAEQVVGYEPLNPYYLDTYGWAYFKLGKFDDALKMVEYAKTLQPKNAIIIDHLGDIYWTLGRKQEAIYEWKKALNYLATTKSKEYLTPSKLNKKIHFGLK
ncbi:MAG: tetratricopeptide repeat protein [Alphaproteobacteria bacterium]